MNDIDTQIDEFHRAGRRRKAWIFGISGVLMRARRRAPARVVHAGGDEDVNQGRYPVKVIVGGVAFLVGGLSSCYNAYRVGSGQVNDVESADVR